MGTYDFRTKVALVTGAASGIGFATAKQIAEGGGRIIGVDRNGERMKNLLNALPKNGQTHLAIEKDLRSVAAAQEVVPETLELAGKIDIVVNAAGVCYFTRIQEIMAEEFNEMFEVNVRALFFISVAAAESMDAAKGGRIINLGSNAGRKGRALSAHYAASKAAVKNISESLALAYGSKHITVNTVCPGPVETPMWETNFKGLKAITGKESQDFWDMWKTQTPLGRVGTPEDVANLICFLASDKGGFINGQEINVCGGFMLTS